MYYYNYNKAYIHGIIMYISYNNVIYLYINRLKQYFSNILLKYIHIILFYLNYL